MQYTSLPKTTRAADYLCRLCTDDRRAYYWDHCHDHGYVRGPVCASCNTFEGGGMDFLTREGGILHLLECTGCRNERVLPRRHREGIARQLAEDARHDGCAARPYGRLLDHKGTTLRFELTCHGHTDPVQWEQEVSGTQVTKLTRQLIDEALSPRQPDGEAPDDGSGRFKVTPLG